MDNNVNDDTIPNSEGVDTVIVPSHDRESDTSTTKRIV